MKINHWLSSFDRNICYRLYLRKNELFLFYRQREMKEKKLNNKCECLFIYLFKWKKVWMWILYTLEIALFTREIPKWYSKLIYFYVPLIISLTWLTRAYMNYFKIMQCTANFAYSYFSFRRDTEGLSTDKLLYSRHV